MNITRSMLPHMRVARGVGGVGGVVVVVRSARPLPTPLRASSLETDTDKEAVPTPPPPPTTTAATTTAISSSDTSNPNPNPNPNPWTDAPWCDLKWTIYRGVAYDLTAYLASDKHPGGSFLLRLGVGRDATGLFESYHLRPEVAVSHLRRLPTLEGFPVEAVPASPRPNDSELYNAIRDRVRKEVFRGNEIKGMHRSGTEGAAAAILGYAAAAWSLYYLFPNVLTGALLGLAGAWIGLTVQHCGNHGAMSNHVLVNQLYGLCSDLTGGSALMWRYHHQVSHHIHCNDDALDEDVFSALPLLRFDPRLPREWFHAYQHVYMWLMFPFLQIVFQIGDLKALVTGKTPGVSLYGANRGEKTSVVLGKVAHWALLWVLPIMAHGWGAVVPAALAYTAAQGIVLSSTFAVSHNLEENKPVPGGSVTTTALSADYATRDWGVQQVLTSSNWGGVVGNFFTGGLNLQIEHHLFPAIAFTHYPAIAAIVRDECEQRGIQYVHYDTLPEIIARFVAYMKQVGREDVPAVLADTPAGQSATAKAALQARL